MKITIEENDGRRTVIDTSDPCGSPQQDPRTLGEQLFVKYLNRASETLDRYPHWTPDVKMLELARDWPDRE